ncbi:uncharacterized protein RMCC_0572 [Mycolicibacterium canariasense]|uniref:DUF5709 domain-containing protein n=1 Tax=Mycolicibacterium canariasense TaxID=228230 RepID=A0A100W8P9_MYCCR|nr:DUF5709 domain-containing protein [Mycolicibacterium canariasense]MCV7213354.1 hypothetical protein [Mycolicibacterium canariasense]ORV10647.1 hypothetical protein AWB94_06750 [Mycolicibacterium canariasense]GAS93606.1 uncharacterized protein RMCC_0572 [Mycolicibacterium canariasense]
MSDSQLTGAPVTGPDTTDMEDQLQPQDTLVDRGVTDALDEGFSAPERPVGTAALIPSGDMDRLLAQEEPDPAARLNVPLDEAELHRSDAAEQEAEFPRHEEVGRARAGRLVAPDLGHGEDTEAQLVATDVGICGGAASAEEAAVHVIENADQSLVVDE